MFLDEGYETREKGVATKMQVTLKYILQKIKKEKYTVLRIEKIRTVY